LKANLDEFESKPAEQGSIIDKSPNSH